MPKVETRLAGTPAWFDVMTPDLEGARKFYGELFGWTFLVGPAEMGYYTMCKLGNANAAGMGLRPNDAPYPPCWSIYFKSDDIQASVAAVKANGGQVTMEPMAVGDSGHMAVCMDPTGAVFGFWQYGTHKGGEVADEPGAMTWAEVYTREGTKARDFYSKILGFAAHKLPGGLEYWTLGPESEAKCGVMQMNEKMEGVPPHWCVYFAVADADVSVKLVEKLGGKLVAPVFDSPYGRIANVMDPWGASFAVIQLAMPS
jgi:uncharacterized protein